MHLMPIDDTQRRAARAVGLAYLLVTATAVFTEMYARGLVVPDAMETARNLMAQERLFRVGIASYLLCMVGSTVLAAGLYVVLSPVERGLALLAVLLRMVEVVLGVTANLNSFEALRVLSGAEYLQAFSAEQLAALARVPLAVHGSTLNIGFIFLGLGSALFGWLWLRSRLIPKVLAILGIGAALLLGAAAMGFVIEPKLQRVLFPFHMLPMGLFEVTMGFLLLFKGLPADRR